MRLYWWCCFGRVHVRNPSGSYTAISPARGDALFTCLYLGCDDGTRGKLIIELDGLHHKEVNKKEYDDIRTDYFNSIEILTLCFTNAQMKTQFKYVCKKIDEAISSRIA